MHRPVRPSAPLAPPPMLDIERHALFLDLDGTLAEIEERPHAVELNAELRALLTRLAREMRGAVALITGRTIVEASRVIHGALSNIAGVHGYELQRDGRILRDGAELSPIAGAAEDVRVLMQEHALPALVEDKRASLALHYRQTPNAGPRVIELAEEIAARRGLRVIRGRMVVELVAGQRTKGDAVRTFMSEAPFAGRIPVALGDDVTDEDAFAATAAIGGFGVLIGAPRQTAAVYALAGPSAVRVWLASPFGAAA